jgi:peptide/nickel transport system permease protein
MIVYTVQRLLQAVLTLLLILVVVFTVLRLTSDPVALLLPPTATQEDFAEQRRLLGLDKPIPEQFLIYVEDVLRGDFGRSLRYRRPVVDMIADGLPTTAILLIAATVLSAVAGIALGVFAAVKKGTLWSGLAMMLAAAGQALPSFWLALLLILFFVVRIPLFPITSGSLAERMVLPVIAIAVFPITGVARVTMSSMLTALDSEYIKLVRLKGVPERVVIFGHALRNATIPILTQAGLQVITLTNSVVIAETIFALNGLGKLSVDGVNNRDFPLVQGTVLMIAAFIVTLNLVIDLLYALIDPRIRLR